MMEEILRIIIVNIIMSFSICFYQFLSNYHALINNEYKMKKGRIRIDMLIREICMYHEFLDYCVRFDLNLDAAPLE